MGNFKTFYFSLMLLLWGQFSIAQILRAGDVSFNLENLNGTDSIRLSGYISDCGEFGGHWEFIVLKKNSGHFSASFNQEPPCKHIQDSMNHRNDTTFTKEVSLHTKPEIKLTKNKIILLQKYFKEFPEIGSDCGDSYSNARSEFSIATPAWQMVRQDQCNRSKIFVILRDQLFVQ